MRLFILLMGVFMLLYEYIVIYVHLFTIKSMPPIANTMKGKRLPLLTNKGRQTEK